MKQKKENEGVGSNKVLVMPRFAVGVDLSFLPVCIAGGKMTPRRLVWSHDPESSTTSWKERGE